MSMQTLGPIQTDQPLIVRRGQIVIKDSPYWSSVANLLQSILQRVAPMVVNNAFMIQLDQVPVFGSNAAALAGGLTPGNIFRSGTDPDQLFIVH